MAGKRFDPLDLNRPQKAPVAPWILVTAAVGLLAFSLHLALKTKAPEIAPPPEPALISQALPLPQLDSPAQQADRPRLELGAIESTSDNSIAPPAKTEAPPPSMPESLPPLEQSDDWLRQQAGALSTESLYQVWLRNERLVHKLALLVDSLAEGRLPSRLRAQLPKLAKPFPVKALSSDNSLYQLDPAGYQRYKPLITALVALDDEAVAGLYQRSKPLLQAAFAELGNDRRNIDAAFLAAIDQFLIVSVPKGNIELIRPSVMYKFADPVLEKRSAVTKLLIRMGPANAEMLQDKLRHLRTALRQATPITPPVAPAQTTSTAPPTPLTEQIPLALPPLSPLPTPVEESPSIPADKPKPRTIPLLETLPPAKAGAAANCCRH